MSVYDPALQTAALYIHGMASGMLLTPMFRLYGYNRQTQLNSEFDIYQLNALFYTIMY